MSKIIVNVPVMSDAIKKLGVPLSPVVKANGFVFVSGTPPLDLETGAIVRGDIETQTDAVMRNLKRALEAAGSSLDKVVKVNIYAANAAYYSVINKVYGRYFQKDPPARTFVPVAGWPMEFDIEIECTALE
ncbi:MAG: RidA family protein [Proteobacteria bacterium]|nr:RidA family protein [Pseudomonadota bacterium]MBI3496628.1 RidA family protein [Pseudomonadota bacterium]